MRMKKTSAERYLRTVSPKANHKFSSELRMFLALVVGERIYRVIFIIISPTTQVYIFEGGHESLPNEIPVQLIFLLLPLTLSIFT
ncbi:CLUMA_CG000637, isoform A [Clunio marinus]|uniref:CLUMA_CG000637, isoform A n=1 Tax=Clunio marinus TaxID=568069 RepID=A0A1J1HK09_9DIPT|nr:CLUMA_CG000637, isoform A [Clunio marinus]